MKKIEYVNQNILALGRHLNFISDYVMLPNGKYSNREYLAAKAEAVVVAALDNKRQVVLVKQYRYPVKNEVWELPAGVIDSNETIIKTAERELKEETGYSSTNFKHLISFYASPGISTEVLHLVLAWDIKLGKQKLDEEENIEVIKIPLYKAKEWILTGKIRDAKTIIGVLSL